MMTIDWSIAFLIGIIGQLCFAGRFIIQWIYSEKKQRSVIPNSFWYISMVGSVCVLTYAILIHDIIFTIGAIGSLIIYTRNIGLVKKKYMKSSYSTAFKPIEIMKRIHLTEG